MNVTGMERAKRLINAYKLDARDFEHIYKNLGSDTVNWITKNFETEGVQGGKKWTDLAESTKLARATRGESKRRKTMKSKAQAKGKTYKPKTTLKQYGSKKIASMTYKILQDFGNLKGSTTFRLTTIKGVQGLIVGLGTKYAPVHEYGSKDGKIPQRKILPKPKTAEKLFMTHMIRRIRMNVKAKSGQTSGLA